VLTTFGQALCTTLRLQSVGVEFPVAPAVCVHRSGSYSPYGSRDRYYRSTWRDLVVLPMVIVPFDVEVVPVKFAC
jgi:hypothetical protein